jgi:hypothetical protein
MIVFAASEYPGLKNPEKSLILLPLMILVSWLSYRFVEQPFRTLGKGTGTPLNFLASLTSNRDRIQLGAMTAVAVVAFGSIAAYARPLPSAAESSTLNANITKWANWNPYAADQTATTNGQSASPSSPTRTSGKTTADSDGPTPERIKLIEAGLSVRRASSSAMASITKLRNQPPFHGFGCEDSARSLGPPSATCRLTTEGSGTALGFLNGKNVVLVGNSYVQQWIPAIRRILPTNTTLTTLTIGSCVPIDFTGTIKKTNDGGINCGSWAKWELDQIHRIKPALVIASTVPFRAGTSVATDGVNTFMKSISKSKARVLWIGTLPGHDNWDVCVKGSNDITACTPQDFAAGALDPAVKFGVEANGGHYWDLQPLFCTADGCPALISDKPVRMDGKHLTEATVLSVRNELSSAIRSTFSVGRSTKQ